jgi:hypothetical protein
MLRGGTTVPKDSGWTTGEWILPGGGRRLRILLLAHLYPPAIISSQLKNLDIMFTFENKARIKPSKPTEGWRGCVPSWLGVMA